MGKMFLSSLRWPATKIERCWPSVMEYYSCATTLNGSTMSTQYGYHSTTN